MNDEVLEPTPDGDAPLTPPDEGEELTLPDAPLDTPDEDDDDEVVGEPEKTIAEAEKRNLPEPGQPTS